MNAFPSTEALWTVHAAVAVWFATAFVVGVVQYRVRFSALRLCILSAWVALAHARLRLCVPARDRVIWIFARSIRATIRDTFPREGSDDQRRKGNQNEEFHSGTIEPKKRIPV